MNAGLYQFAIHHRELLTFSLLVSQNVSGMLLGLIQYWLCAPVLCFCRLYLTVLRFSGGKCGVGIAVRNVFFGLKFKLIMAEFC